MTAADFSDEPVPLSRHAERALGLGPVFPLKPRAKTPATRTGYQAATLDRERVEAIWSATPDANIGLACGVGLVVIDVDGETGAESLDRLELELGALPETYRVETSSSSWHLYFETGEASKVSNSAGKLGAGLDVRGRGGYVVGAGSIHPSGAVYVGNGLPIATLPAEWLERLVKKRPPASPPDSGLDPPSSSSPPRATAGGLSRYATRALEAECAAVASAAAGTRNDRLNTAAFNVGTLGERDDATIRGRLLEAAHACGLVGDDGQAAALATIHSGLEAGRQHPRAPRDLKAGGTRVPPASERAVEGLAEVAAGVDSSTLDCTPLFPITVYTARELAELELPEPARPIVGPYVRAGMITLLAGITGHGKTTLIAQMVKAAVDGGDLLGENVEGGARVLVLDLEQHLASIQRVIVEAGLAESDLVDYAPIPEGLALDKRTDQLSALENVLSAKPYELLVIDPFYKLHEADSSDELQARLLVALLRRWIRDYRFAILTATHCRKLTAGRLVITLDDLFGSSLFTRDPEVILGLQRHGGLSKLHVFKSREPGLDSGRTPLELLFSRGRGFYLKPTVDPEERKARLQEIGAAAIEWITDNPGQSTNKVKAAVGSTLKCGGELVEEALCHEVKSGLLPEPLKGSRNAKLWYPLNHAALTSPESLLGEVTDSARQASTSSTSPDLPYLPVGGREGQEVKSSEADPTGSGS